MSRLSALCDTLPTVIVTAIGIVIGIVVGRLGVIERGIVIGIATGPRDANGDGARALGLAAHPRSAALSTTVGARAAGLEHLLLSTANRLRTNSSSTPGALPTPMRNGTDTAPLELRYLTESTFATRLTLCDEQQSRKV